MGKNKNKNTNDSANVLTPERLMIELIMGSRKPVNDHEKKLQAEIDEIKKQGYVVEIPFDI